jgi:hypothetical protein
MQQRSCSHSVSCSQACRRIPERDHGLASAPSSPDTVTPVGDFTLPAACFLHVHVDLVEPPLTSAGYTYCLTAVDRLKPLVSHARSWSGGEGSPRLLNLVILLFYCFISCEEINIVIILKLSTVMENPPLLTTNVHG